MRIISLLKIGFINIVNGMKIDKIENIRKNLDAVKKPEKKY